MTATHIEPAKITKGLVIFGAIALVVAGVGGWFNRRQFFISYLSAYFFWFGLGIGCAVVAMIHHLTGGRWGYPVKRFLEAAFATLPLMALLFVPVLFGQTNLYPWAMKQRFGAAVLETNYLNKTQFT